MPTHIRHGRSPCPVARSLDVLGDKWTLLIIREALSGTTRFMDFSHQLPGLARTLLSQRLKRLIALGVFETIPSARRAITTSMCSPPWGANCFRWWLRCGSGAPITSSATPNRGHAWLIGAPRCRTHRWVCSSADGEPLAPEDTQTVVRGPDSVGD